MDLVEDGFDVAVFGAGVGADIKGLFGAIPYSRADGVWQCFWRNFDITKVKRAIASKDEGHRILAERGGL